MLVRFLQFVLHMHRSTSLYRISQVLILSQSIRISVRVSVSTSANAEKGFVICNAFALQSTHPRPFSQNTWNVDDFAQDDRS